MKTYALIFLLTLAWTLLWRWLVRRARLKSLSIWMQSVCDTASGYKPK